LGSEDTVGRPKNYQAKVPGTVSRTKRSANFSPPQSQALFRVQEKHQIEHVWVSFYMFWRPTFFIDENCKITEPAFACILYHVSTQEIHRQKYFRDTSLTICRMAKSTEKRQKVGLFQRFFHPSMSIFPRFPTFPALSNFYSRTMMPSCPLCRQELAGPELCPSCGSLEGLDGDKFFSPVDQLPAEPLRSFLFLDVDGVLNWVGVSAPEALEPELVQALALLLRRCSGGAPGAIRVVLSRCARAPTRPTPRARSRPPLARGRR
jgi:hypothetical protein